MTYKCHKSCFRIKFNHRKWQWQGLVVLTRGNADGCFKETTKQVVSVKRAQEVVPSAFLGLISNLDPWSKFTHASYKHCSYRLNNSCDPMHHVNYFTHDSPLTLLTARDIRWFRGSELDKA